MATTIHRDFASGERHNCKDHSHTVTEDGGVLSAPVVADYMEFIEGTVVAAPGAGKARLQALTGGRVGYITADIAANITPASDAFPASPVDGQPHFREDLGSGWVWDNVMGLWLGPEFILMGRSDTLTFTTDAVLMRTYVANIVPTADYAGLWLTRWEVATNVDTTNDIFNYWIIELGGTTDPTTPTPGGLGVLGAMLDTASDAPSTWVYTTQAGGGLNNQLIDPTYVAMALTVRIFGGAPGALDVVSTLYARALRTA